MDGRRAVAAASLAHSPTLGRSNENERKPLVLKRLPGQELPPRRKETHHKKVAEGSIEKYSDYALLLGGYEPGVGTLVPLCTRTQTGRCA